MTGVLGRGSSKRCPTCGGGTLGRLPNVNLNTNTVARGNRHDTGISVQPKEAEFLHVLVAAWPRGVKAERLALKLWGRNAPDNPIPSLRLYAYRLRQIIGPWGYGIERVRGVQGITHGGFRLTRITPIRQRHAAPVALPDDERVAA
jgi:DNA-binding winged helix-turn-helix (wHTH) protein